MADALLIPLWIPGTDPQGPFGLGVTARSVDDAIAILRGLGYGPYLPADVGKLTIKENVTITELESLGIPALATNIGPLNVRGVWYPFWQVGVPGWAEERIHDPRG